MTGSPLPSDFDQIDLPVYEWRPAQGPLLRVHRRGLDPLYFNRPPAVERIRRYRFDAPDGEYGILYGAPTFGVCFCETVLRETPATTPGAQPVVLADSAITNRAVARLAVTQPLRLVNFAERLAACRADLSLMSTPNYTVPNQWGLAIHRHPGGFDGIYYRTRFTGETGVALFDRARIKIALMSSIPMDDWHELDTILNAYAITRLPPGPGAFD